MWRRRTFHECAEELEIISEDFRRAYIADQYGSNPHNERILRDTSMRGVEILRILALAIRSEQDYGNVPKAASPVGAVQEDATDEDAIWFPQLYRPPYSKLTGFAPLEFRGALNKIAHANPQASTFFCNQEVHDLILTGENRRRKWIAIVSLIDLCATIKSLPDQNTRHC
ncbi:MAG: hypothetical protein AB7H90_02275 [Alphaproteobacteria bacterium]